MALLGQLNAACTAAADLEQAAAGSFNLHPDAGIITSFPGLGALTGARVLAETGDDRSRFPDARGLKAYAGAAPITRASGKTRSITHRRIKNNRLSAVGYLWAFSALTRSPGARAHYDRRKTAGTGEKLSRADREARGKDARAAAPLESQAEFTPGRGRDPVGLLLTWPPPPPRGCRCSYAGTRTWPISARSLPPRGGWSLTSTTSTRPFPARSSGMSSGWRPAWPWPGETTGLPPRTAARSSSRGPRATGRRCAPSRSSRCWRCGVPTWTSMTRSPGTGHSSRRKGSRPPRRCSPRPTPTTACRP